MKPVLLGMNNPLSSRPEHALYPHPVGCTGHRIWKMLEVRTRASQEDYLEAFDRRNLLGVQTWRMADAREAASHFIREMNGRVVLVLGAEPRDALRLPPLLVKPQDLHGVTWRQLPHPSGRNLWYNVPENKHLAELLLEELYRNTNQTAREPRLL